MTDQTIKIVMPKATSSHKHKVKHHIKVKKVSEPKENFGKKMKEEITELEKQRENTPKGVRGFLGKLSINNKINQRRSFLNAERGASITRKQVEFTKAQVELEEQRQKLKQIREKSSVNFSAFDVTGKETGKKGIKFDDLF